MPNPFIHLRGCVSGLFHWPVKRYSQTRLNKKDAEKLARKLFIDLSNQPHQGEVDLEDNKKPLTLGDLLTILRETREDKNYIHTQTCVDINLYEIADDINRPRKRAEGYAHNETLDRSLDSNFDLLPDPVNDAVIMPQRMFFLRYALYQLIQYKINQLDRSDEQQQTIYNKARACLREEAKHLFKERKQINIDPEVRQLAKALVTLLLGSGVAVSMWVGYGFYVEKEQHKNPVQEGESSVKDVEHKQILAADAPFFVTAGATLVDILMTLAAGWYFARLRYPNTKKTFESIETMAAQAAGETVSRTQSAQDSDRSWLLGRDYTEDVPKVSCVSTLTGFSMQP